MNKNRSALPWPCLCTSQGTYVYGQFHMKLSMRALVLGLCMALVLIAGSEAAAQTTPAPAPPPAPQNIFYGETPPGGSGAPVLVFVHGVNARASDWWLPKNDMYNRAFA